MEVKMKDVLVVGEIAQKRLKKATLSAITFAKELAAKVGSSYSIALFGKDVKEAAQEATKFGAKAVYAVEADALENYIASVYAKAVADLANQIGAGFVCAVSSTFSRDLLPRVACRLQAGMVSEVMKIVGDAPPLRYKRPMWAGNVIATVEVKTEKAVFTVRGSEFDRAQEVQGVSQIVEVKPSLDLPQNVRFVGFAETVSERPDLTEASVVVSGGRGLRDKEGFWGLLNPLADVLGAAIGATRAVVDAGIAPNDLQIGQTGKVVAPNLYIAVGLSGAIQHLAGMKNSKVIVAINKDPDAPIFSVADYGLVADAFKAVPELVEEIKKVK
jgi:electron transfer flavoprotein alpha subunit